MYTASNLVLGGKWTIGLPVRPEGDATPSSFVKMSTGLTTTNSLNLYRNPTTENPPFLDNLVVQKGSFPSNLSNSTGKRGQGSLVPFLRDPSKRTWILVRIL